MVHSSGISVISMFRRSPPTFMFLAKQNPGALSKMERPVCTVLMLEPRVEWL